MLNRKFWVKALVSSLAVFLVGGLLTEITWGVKDATVCSFYLWSFVVAHLFFYLEDETLNKIERFVCCKKIAP